MSNADLLPSLLFKINQNQLALEAAQRGSTEVASNVRGAWKQVARTRNSLTCRSRC